jgi:GNAT superfamily N-acetyltransferase
MADTRDGSTGSAELDIRQIDDPVEHLDELFHDLLEPSFAPDELGGLPAVRHVVTAATTSVWAAFDGDGRILGTAVGEYDVATRIMLLSWLAVRPGLRGGGIGRPLLTTALSAWKTEYDPCLILAEVEDPDQHHYDELRGDPAARLRFYRRLGARALDVPYFQAALGAGLRRVPGLLLLVLHAHPDFFGKRPDTLDGAVLRTYLEMYQRECEGAVADDEEASRLWRAVDQPGGVPFRADVPA